MPKRYVLLAAAAAVLAPLVVAALPAGATDHPSPHAASAPSLSDFELVSKGSALPGRVADLDRELPKLGIQKILEQGNRDATSGSKCSSPALSTMDEAPIRKFCFNPSDTGKVGGTTEWMPQGVTTVADAQDDQMWGTKQALAVSWYDKGIAPVKGVRLTFLDPATNKYQHVLLAYPYTNAEGNPSYEPVTTPQKGDGGSVHAGGVLWYGQYIYVVDTVRGIRVFDTSKIFDLKTAGDKGNVTDGKQVGRHNGVYYGFGYRYVMPEVGTWENPGGLATFPPKYGCNVSGPEKFSYISLDRSENPDQLITGEYCSSKTDPDTHGRVAQWPLNGDTGMPAVDADGHWRADNAYRLPKPNVQGAVSTDGRWYLSSTGGGETGPAHLQAATGPGKGTGVLSTTGAERNVAIGAEDLSYWPGKNEIWTVTEHPGKRVLYSVAR